MLVIWILKIRICLGFRYSNFGFILYGVVGVSIETQQTHILDRFVHRP